MDGINGITGFYSIVVLLGFYFVNLKEQIVENNLIIYPLFSLVIFGFYNFRKKARMFAGDIGSISIAVLLFFLGAYFIKETSSPILILFILVYGADTILTIGYRKSIGEKISEPHRKHIYQKLVHTLGLSHLKVAALYAVVQGVVCSLVYFGYQMSFVNQLVVIFCCMVVFALAYLYLFKLIDKKKALV